MKKLALFFASGILMFMFILLSCSKDKPLPSGYKLVVGDREGVIADTVLTLEPGSEKYYSRKMDTSDSPKLLLGTYDGYRSGFFLQFSNMPDSIHINSAELILTVKDRIAPGDSSFWDASHQALANIFLADTTVDENTPPIPSADLQITSFTFYSDSAAMAEIKIELDSNLVNQWIERDSPIQHYGLWIESPDAEFMTIYYAREINDAGLVPQINLYYSIVDTAGNSIDTSTVVYVSSDQFILLNDEQDLNLNPDLFYVGKGLAFRNFMKFDLAGFDSTTHVNRAILKLTINSGYSIRDKLGVLDCRVYRLTEEWVDGDVSEEQLGSLYSPDVVDSLLEFDITPSIQGFLGHNYDNFGFLVRSANEGDTIERIAFYSTKADLELQPKIYLYYTLPPDQEF